MTGRFRLKIIPIWCRRLGDIRTSPVKQRDFVCGDSRHRQELGLTKRISDKNLSEGKQSLVASGPGI